MNRFHLKILMLIFMLLDTIYYFIPNTPQWFHWVGLIVAPVFFYLLVDGYFKTKSKSNYNKRLLLASQIMFLGNTVIAFLFPKIIDNKWQVLYIGKRTDVPSTRYIVVIAILIIGLFSVYYVLKQKVLTNKIALIMSFILIVSDFILRRLFKGQFLFVNNIFLSMTFSLSMLRGIDRYRETKDSKGAALAGLAFSLSAFTEALTIGPLMVLIFYFYKDKKLKLIIYYALLSSIFLVGMDGKIMLDNPQWIMIFALIFILIYNEKKGKDLRYLFYTFYPIHIWVIYLVSYFIYKV